MLTKIYKLITHSHHLLFTSFLTIHAARAATSADHKGEITTAIAQYKDAIAILEAEAAKPHKISEEYLTLMTDRVWRARGNFLHLVANTSFFIVLVCNISSKDRSVRARVIVSTPIICTSPLTLLLIYFINMFIGL